MNTTGDLETYANQFYSYLPGGVTLDGTIAPAQNALDQQNAQLTAKEHPDARSHTACGQRPLNDQCT